MAPQEIYETPVCHPVGRTHHRFLWYDVYISTLVWHHWVDLKQIPISSSVKDLVWLGEEFLRRPTRFPLEEMTLDISTLSSCLMNCSFLREHRDCKFQTAFTRWK